MAVDKLKLIYYKDNGTSPVTTTEIEIDDIVSCSVRKTAKVKNNSADIMLKNPLKKILNSHPIHKWINDDGTMMFKTPKKIGESTDNEAEKIEIFAKRVTDPSDDISTSSNSVDRVFTGYITELEGKGGTKTSTIKLKLTDRNSILLNNTGVGIYSKPEETGTITSVTSTTITDSSKSWTVDEFKGMIVLFTKGTDRYRYTIISNSSDTLTVKPDDDVSGDGFSASDTFEICWTAPSILFKTIDKVSRNRIMMGEKIVVKFDFEDSDRKQISAVGKHTLTLSGASYSTNELVNRVGHITSGDAKGKGLIVKSNTADTLTFYGDTDLTTLNISAGTDYFTLAGEESGIETMRPDGSAYPAITYSKAFKPIYEWCEELSQINNINTEAEIGADNGIVCKIPAVYHIDVRNVFYWFYPSDEAYMEIDAYANAPVGEDTSTHIVKGRQIKNKVRDTVNFIIYRYKNFDGVELLDYRFDPTRGAAIVQDCYRPYYSESNKLIKAAYQAGEIDAEEYGATITFTYGSNYPSWWSSDSMGDDPVPANDSDYKDLFEKACIFNCNIKADAEINKSGSGRWEGTIALDYEPIQINEMIKYTDYALGVPGVNMRIKEVTYHFRKNSFRSDIKIEEDLDPYNKVS